MHDFEGFYTDHLFRLQHTSETKDQRPASKLLL